MVAELTQFMAERPSAAELADARRAYLEGQKVSRTGAAALAGQIVANLQLGRAFTHISEREKRMAALTAADVQAVFRKYIDPKKLVVSRAGDFKQREKRNGPAGN